MTTNPAPSALDQAQRAIRFQRFGPAKGVAGALTTASIIVPAELLLRTVAGRNKAHLPVAFHRGLARSLGIRITCHGARARQKGVLFVANHVSWADIPVLGARIPAAFVAKSDVAGWGMVGWLATLARTVYVERSRPSSTGEQRDAISGRLMRGDSVILFPEGTNGDGTHVLPFKSSLFAVTDGLPDVLVQPVTIAYTSVNGMPVTRERLPDLAWIGDTELMPHAMAFMALGRVKAEIIFHPAVRAADFAGRKALARYCETVIGNGYRKLMRG
nr:lysophospholipid acyltransferase family protein [Polymorphobacter sp.]